MLPVKGEERASTLQRARDDSRNQLRGSEAVLTKEYRTFLMQCQGLK